MTGRPGSAESADDPDEDDPGLRTYALDLVSSGSAVLLVGALLFAVSGVWPPLVAIESPSMEPHIDTGDLVFVMEADRFPGPGHHEPTGVVTAAVSERSGYTEFEKPGDVIVYAPDGDDEKTPIIHRAMFWVRADEDWYDRADPRYVGAADDCGELANCPAPHAGFVTKGDNNDRYDQAGTGISTMVRPTWIVGTAEARVPELGRVRLLSGRVAASDPASVDDRGVSTPGPNATAGPAPAL